MTSTQLQLAQGFELPLDAVTETFGILAMRGSGKTYTAGVLVEELLAAGQPVVVVDPVGVWWGLRSSADGKKPGEAVVIFGGDHADVPLTETAGTLLADVVVEERLSCVLDLSELSKSATRRFLADFAERLYQRNRDPLHLVLDEADAFAPQRTQRGGERLLGAIDDIVRRGRARGLGCTMITQRPAVLNKDVLTQIGVLIALRMTGPRDVAAIDEWVRQHADPDDAATVKASLPSLPVGTAWVWSPGWLGVLEQVKVRTKRTFDSSVTPRAGRVRPTPRTRAEIDLTGLEKKIAATVEEEAATDPVKLRREVGRLRAQLDQATTATAVEIRETPVVTDEHVDALRTQLDRLTALVDQHQAQGRELSEQLNQVAESLAAALTVARRTGETPAAGSSATSKTARSAGTTRTSGPAASPANGQKPRSRPSPPAKVLPKVAGRASAEVELRAGARRMVEALGRFAPLHLTRSQWGTVSGMKSTSGTWSTYLSDLRRGGLIEETPKGFTLTDAGFDLLGGRPDPMTPAELQEHYRRVLRRGAAAMFDALLAAYPDGLTRDQLGEAADMAPTSGTFSTYLSDLTRNGLAVRQPDKTLVATEVVVYGADLINQ